MRNAQHDPRLAKPKGAKLSAALMKRGDGFVAAPITDETRNLITTLHAQGLSRNAIAKQAGVSGATVTKVCHQAGLTFDRTATRAAVAAAVVDAKARRAELTQLLLEDAHRLRQQLWEPTTLLNFGGKDNTLNSTTLPEPLFVDKKNIMSAVGTAVDRIVKLETLDNDNGVSDAESMLNKLIEGIGIPDE